MKKSSNSASFYIKYGKRLIDVVFSLIGMIVLALPMLATAVLIKVKMGSPILFKQPRPGKNEKIFLIYKFRTMNNLRDGKGELLPDEMRVEKFGRLLRAKSIDELPELWNILKGDMSLIGPRPLLVKYLPRYSPKLRRRHTVRPGLSGLTQVKGRNALNWDDKFAFDIEYVDNITFFGDIKLIGLTIAKVVRAKKYEAETEAAKHYT